MTIEQDLSSSVGASDVGALFGVDNFRDAGDVYDRLMGVSNFKYTPPMRRGHKMEAVIAKEYEEQNPHGRKVCVFKDLLIDESLPYLVGHLDRRLSNGDGKIGVLEIKSRNGHMVRQIKLHGLDLSTALQLQTYIRMTKWDYGTFVTISYDNWELLHFDIEPDLELQGRIVETVGRFWQDHVLKGIRPDVTKPQAVELPETAKGEVTTIDTPEWAKAAQDLREAKELEKDAQMILEAPTAEIQAIMKELGADVCEGSGLVQYWKEQAGRKSFDWEALKKAHPPAILNQDEKNLLIKIADEHEKEALDCYGSEFAQMELEKVAILRKVITKNLDLTPFFKHGKAFRTFKSYFTE